ncbi:hypothetical protein [uncultured Friedmanniella sp.]|uniref:hypothetical protein n=1 Tax=uncultured Friedmanniella sp. TaxID=335381 RepID=UPI0035CBFB77
MTIAEEFGFQSDPAPMAFDLMRSIWTEDPDSPLDERMDFIRALSGDVGSSIPELVAWMRRAVQD